MGEIILKSRNSLGMFLFLLDTIVLGALFYLFPIVRHQYFVPLRDASFFDLIADSLGSWAGVFLGRACFRRRTFD